MVLISLAKRIPFRELLKKGMTQRCLASDASPKRDTVDRILLSEDEMNPKAQSDQRPHVPVMASEVVKAFNPQPGQVFVDMTFGGGGHSEHLLNAEENIRIYALDRDPCAHQYAQTMAEKYQGKIIPMLGKFSDLATRLHEQGVNEESIDGILFDVGVSSMQMNDLGRGFALSRDEPLDMRMDGPNDPNQPSACDVINTLSESALARIFKVYGEEKYAKAIARTIVEARYMLRNVTTTGELAVLVSTLLDSPHRQDKLQRPSHPATKIFQALRIFVNDELNELDHGMELAYHYLKPGGTLVAITFHSLEDRIVKRHIQGVDVDEKISSSLSQKYLNASKWHTEDEVSDVYSNRFRPVNKRVETPSPGEVESNPRSRSAKLRAAKKIE